MRTFIHLACSALMLLLPTSAGRAEAASVGFQHLRIAGPGGAPTEVGVWYPTSATASPQRLKLFSQTVAVGAPVEGRRLPLVVISHGSGGDYAGHYDTALALAGAGFIVASLTHPGDNVADHRRQTDLPLRVRGLERLIDYMVAEWPAAAVDPGRVGAFGFSAGGFTVLGAAGGRPHLSRIGAHCREHPEFFDCNLVRHSPTTVRLLGGLAGLFWPGPDRRIRAEVVAAPALGFTFGRDGLQRVTIPVQLWRGERDAVLPHPFNAEAVRTALPQPPESHVVPGAGHYDFLAPCTAALRAAAPPICASEPSFDRSAFHEDFNRQVVRFFTATLSARSSFTGD